MQVKEHSQELIAARAFGTFLLLALAISMAMLGCEQKKKVLEVEAPGIHIEVDEKKGLDGSKSIEVKKERPTE